MTQKNEPSKAPGKERKVSGAPKFKSTLPMARKPGSPRPKPAAGADLDLDLSDIESRLPYGSEDIADK